MCPSEVSDIDDGIWGAYADDGVVVWAIASADPLEEVERFRDALGLELPILYDAGGVVHQDYVQTSAFATAAYPQQWVIGTDGNIAWANNEYDLGELRAVIEAELAGE